MISGGLRVAFHAGWVLAVFWEVAWLRAINVQNDVFTSDLLHEHLPLRAVLGETLRRGEWPLWIPGIYTGFPLLGHVETGSLYPTNALLFTVLPPYVAIAYAQLLPLVIVGVGTSLLASRYGLPAAAALLAGGAMSVSGFFVSHLRHPHMIDAACWVPFLLLLVEKLIATGATRHAVGLALVWASSLLAGHPQMSYNTALLVLVYFAVRTWQTGRSTGTLGRFRELVFGVGARRLSFALAIGALVAAAQLVPGAELAALGHRRGGIPWEMAAQYPVSPASLWSFVDPYRFGDVADATFRLPGIFWEQYAYLGLFPALLALFAAVTEWRDPRVRLWVAVALVSTLLALGPNTPLFSLAFTVVPGMSYFRFPTRFLLFTDLAVALLAAFGLGRLLRMATRGGARALIATIVLVTTAADLRIHQRRQVPLVDWETWKAPIETVERLRALETAAEGPWRYFPLETMRLHVEAFEESRGWSGDLTRYVAHRELLQPSFNLLHGLETAGGYTNLVPAHYEAIWGSALERGLARPSGRLENGLWVTKPSFELALRLFNVRYVLSKWPLASTAFRELDVTGEGVRLYELPDALPRAFVVGRVRAVMSDAEAVRVLRDGDLDPAAEALVHDAALALPDDARSSTDVRFLERSSARLRLEATLDHPGLLVLSEGHYPGWTATLDGRSVPVFRSNVMMRAVVLPPGRHEVTFELRSAAVRAGVALSLLGILALVGFAIRR